MGIESVGEMLRVLKDAPRLQFAENPHELHQIDALVDEHGLLWEAG